MFSIGDFVFDTQTGANVQIMERIELWGYTSYKVFNPSTGNVYRATEEQLHMGGNEAQLDENYLRYVVLLSKIFWHSIFSVQWNYSVAASAACAKSCLGDQ